MVPPINNQNAKNVLFHYFDVYLSRSQKKAFYGNKAKFFGAKIAPFKKGKKRAKSFDHARVP